MSAIPNKSVFHGCDFMTAPAYTTAHYVYTKVEASRCAWNGCGQDEKARDYQALFADAATVVNYDARTAKRRWAMRNGAPAPSILKRGLLSVLIGTTLGAPVAHAE